MKSEMRCHDNRCGVRFECARWINRDDQGTLENPAHHGMTLRPAWQCNDEPCSHAEMVPHEKPAQC